MRRVFAQRGTDWALRPIAANRQPAMAAYCSGQLHTVQVFDVRDGRIARTTVFQSPAVFAAFGLPELLDEPR
jgi:RNA polymerase sigma-70 factor (ECF subfamily)